MSPPQPEFGRVGPPYWSERTTFIVGTGPSLRGFDFERLRGRGHILAVKQAWRDVPFADACFGLDLPWLRWANADLRALAERMPLYLAIPKPPYVLEHYVPGATFLVRERICDALMEDPGVIEAGGNSGFGALNLAWHKKAMRIVLLGFDYTGKHYCNERYEARPDGHNSQYMQNWATNFRNTLPQSQARGVEVITASPSSLVDAFPRMTIDEALALS